MHARQTHHHLFSLDSPGIRLGGLTVFQQMLIPLPGHPGAGGGGRGGGGGTGRSSAASRHHVLMSTSLIVLAALVLASGVLIPAQCVIMPPHRSLYETNHRNHTELAPTSRTTDLSIEGQPLRRADEVPYLLTIIQDNSISVSVNSKSNFTVNLNRAVPQDVSVLLSVNSGPNLIAFDRPKGNATLLTPSKYTEYTITYAANTFGDRVVNFHTNDRAGHAEVVCRVVKQPDESKIVIDDSQAFVSVNIYRYWNLNVIIQIVGWIYFFAWSISFYFQVILNYQRKSVVGLNFDFLVLNLLGFTCYSIYNTGLLFAYTVQQEYYHRYTYSRIPVEYNDLFFALHAFAITLVTVFQCFIYERGDQQISLPAGIFVSLTSALGFILFVAGVFFHALSVLDVVLYLSYVKLVITIIKYTPQAYMNYKRKATTGWSIHNIMLDFTGGSFSLLQMLLIAYNYDDWISIFGNATKFGLGLFSMAFDILFFVQHYVLYRFPQQRLVSNTSENDLENSSDSVPSPIISQSIRSAANTTQAAAASNELEANGDSGEETD